MFGEIEFARIFRRFNVGIPIVCTVVKEMILSDKCVRTCEVILHFQVSSIRNKEIFIRIVSALKWYY